MANEKESLYQARLNRYLTAMEGGKPDRVPCRLWLSEFIAKYAGYNLQEIYYQLDKNFDSVNKLLTDYDLDLIGTAPSLWWAAHHDAVGARYLKFAGHELESNSQFQYVEDEYMLVDDYDDFTADPTKWILTTYLPRIHKEFAEPGSYRANLALIKGTTGLTMLMGRMAQAGELWAREYATPQCFSGIVKAPFDTLGDTLRGLRGVMTDLHRCPEKVKAAMEVLIPHNVFYGIATAAGDTQLPAFLPLHRGSYPFLNPRQWNEYYWPSLKKVIEGLWAKGKRTMFYAEGNWTPYLEKIAELPDKSIVFHVDTTDMARAKEILGGRFCISGNVPNTLLAYGTPQEVREYCQRLIDQYAQDGGFILDAAGVVQWDAKAENIGAVVEAAKEFGVYK